MAKRGKGGKERKRKKRRFEKPPHRFLKESTRSFYSGGSKEVTSDQAAYALFNEVQSAAGVRLFMHDHTHFEVLKPRKAVLPNGARNNVVTRWHGSPASNGMSILRDGLRKGWRGMFGPGIYVGQKRKAEGFAYQAGEAGMLLKVEVALGRVYDATKGMPSLRTAPQGYDSVRGIRGQTESWFGTLEHDEWVVYDPCQVALLEIHLI